MWKQLAGLAATAVFIFGAMAHEPQEAGFTPLFDGKTLAGWEGKTDVFRVVEGAIVAGSLAVKIPNNEFLCTEKEYGDFELRLQAKLVGAGENAGVQFRSARISNHHEVIGYQCDMGKGGGRSIWGALYDESRRRKFLATGDDEKLERVVKQGEYNDLVIRCEGPRVQLWVNGLQTVDFTETQPEVARRGVIALQIHAGEPTEASYRNIRIRTLDGKR